jgi:hypothetical protein
MTPREDGSMVKAETNEDRRKFLATCGRFAIVTPPAITLLLSTSLNSPAVANSGGRGSSDDGGGNSDGGRNGRWWGPPDNPKHRHSL